MRTRIPILRPDAIMVDTFADKCLSFIIYPDLKRHLDAESQALSKTCPVRSYIMQIRYKAQSSTQLFYGYT
jgi:hypothetical protein